MKTLSRVTSLALVMIATAAVAEIPPMDPTTANFNWIESAIIQPKCVACHQNFANYAALRAHLTPGHPESSILFTALGDGQYCQMPQSLNNAPIQCVGLRGLGAMYWWIKAGANPN